MERGGNISEEVGCSIFTSSTPAGNQRPRIAGFDS